MWTAVVAGIFTYVGVMAIGCLVFELGLRETYKKE